MINSPCYGCQIRTTRCHTDCEKYLEYKSKCDNRRAERSKNYDFLITSVIKSTSIRDVENQINERIGEYMEIIANNRANNREYIAFKDLKKAIFCISLRWQWYIKTTIFMQYDFQTAKPLNRYFISHFAKSKIACS